MSCENQDYRNMNAQELLEYSKFHHLKSKDAFAAGDSDQWALQQQESAIMFFRWVEESYKERGQQPPLIQGAGGLFYPAGSFIAGLEMELTVMEALRDQNV